MTKKCKIHEEMRAKKCRKDDTGEMLTYAIPRVVVSAARTIFISKSKQKHAKVLFSKKTDVSLHRAHTHKKRTEKLFYYNLYLYIGTNLFGKSK